MPAPDGLADVVRVAGAATYIAKCWMVTFLYAVHPFHPPFVKLYVLFVVTHAPPNISMPGCVAFTGSVPVKEVVDIFTMLVFSRKVLLSLYFTAAWQYVLVSVVIDGVHTFDTSACGIVKLTVPVSCDPSVVMFEDETFVTPIEKTLKKLVLKYCAKNCCMLAMKFDRIIVSVPNIPGDGGCGGGVCIVVTGIVVVAVDVLFFSSALL